MSKVSIKPFKSKYIINRYVNWLNNPQINKYLQVRFKKQTFDTANKYLKAVDKNKNLYMWGIFVKKKIYSLIGTGTLIHNSKKKEAVIGFMIGNKSYWGKKESSDSFRLIYRYAFDKLFCKKVISNVEENNLASLFMNNKHNFRFLKKYNKIIKAKKLIKINIFKFELKKKDVL